MSDDVINKAAAALNVGTGAVVSDGTGRTGVMENLTSNTVGSGGGQLLPEQSRRFLDYVFDQMVLGNDGRRQIMRANTAEFDKIQVGTRLIRKAAQASTSIFDAAEGEIGFVNRGAQFTKVEVVTTKFRLDYELSTEALEDNLEGSALEDHIVRLMASQFGNDLEDIAINGLAAQGTASYAGTSYPYTIDGFVKLADGAAGSNHFAPAATLTTASTFFTAATAAAQLKSGSAISFFENLYNALPRKYKARRAELKFYASSKNVQTLLTDLRQIGSGGVPEDIASGVLRGAEPRVGGPAGMRTSIFGIPVHEVPLYPDSYVDLTFPQNRIWGFQRDVTVHREFQPKKDTVEYTVYVRMGINIEELSAIAKANAVTG
jgi:hypothetical protein